MRKSNLTIIAMAVRRGWEAADRGSRRNGLYLYDHPKRFVLGVNTKALREWGGCYYNVNTLF